jgi:hypothetical protein
MKKTINKNSNGDIMIKVIDRLIDTVDLDRIETDTMTIDLTEYKKNRMKEKLQENVQHEE